MFCEALVMCQADVRQRSDQATTLLQSFLGELGDDVVFADTPDQTTIAAAAKFSGRVGNWSIGVLDAVTTEEMGRYLSTDGQQEELLVEPLSNYAVARVQQQVEQGARQLRSIICSRS